MLCGESRIEWLYKLSHPLMSIKLTFISNIFWIFLMKHQEKQEKVSNPAHIFFVIIYSVLCTQCNPSANFNFISYSLCLNSAFLILNIYGSLWEEYIKMADGGHFKHFLDWKKGTPLWIYSLLSKKVHNVW